MLIISTLYNLDLITNIETQGRYFHFAQGDSFLKVNNLARVMEV